MAILIVEPDVTVENGFAFLFEGEIHDFLFAAGEFRQDFPHGGKSPERMAIFDILVEFGFRADKRGFLALVKVAEFAVFIDEGELDAREGNPDIPLVPRFFLKPKSSSLGPFERKA